MVANGSLQLFVDGCQIENAEICEMPAYSYPNALGDAGGVPGFAENGSTFRK